MSHQTTRCPAHDPLAHDPRGHGPSVSSALTRESPLQVVLRLMIRGYQRFISPLLPPACRFSPTCSSYALEAIRGHGAFAGSWLAARRLGRCHPFHPGGYDPVPPPPGAGE